VRETHYDICILGGGMAGCAAALAAARSGAQVVLVERMGFLGGAATAGAVSQLVGWHTRAGRKVIAGVADEIVSALRAIGGATEFDRFVMSTGNVMDRLGYDPDLMKVTLDRLISNAGVQVMFHTAFVESRGVGGLIESITVATLGGRLDIYARCFLDMSGDLALLSDAGARFLPEAEHGRQPATMMFALAPVDFACLDAVTIDEKNKIIAAGLACGALPRAALHHSRVPGSNVGWFNISRVKVDATDPVSLSRGEMEGREQALAIARFLIENLPGCEGARLCQFAPVLGVRDTRRVEGLHVLTASELRQNEPFKDTIACGAYPIDIHHANSHALTIEEFGEDHYYRIPFRSLLPVGLRNIATAGRGLSADETAFAAVRVMPTAMATGHAAGIAAVIASEMNVVDFAGVPIARLRESLLLQNAFLGN